MFRALGALPGRDFDRYGAAALADCAPDEAADLAEALVDANLLLEPTPDRYQFHDLIRDFARDLARRTGTDLDAATDRLFEYYLQALYNPLVQQGFVPLAELGDRPPVSALPKFASQREAVQWADGEVLNVAAAVEQATARGRPEYTWRLTLVVMHLLKLRGYRQQEQQVVDLGLHAARLTGDREAEALMLHALSIYRRGLGQTQAAADALREALAILPAEADPRRRQRLYTSLGITLQTADPFGEALPALDQAADIARRVQDDDLLARALTFRGMALGNAGEYAAAEPAYVEALTILRRGPTSGLQSDALSGLTTCYARLGRLDEAMATAIEARDVAIELESPLTLPFALVKIALVHQLRGEAETAVGLCREAAAMAEQVGNLQVRWTTQEALGSSLLAAGHTDESLACFERLHRDAVADRNNGNIVTALTGLADHATVTGNRSKAREYLEAALAITDEFSPARSTTLRAKLDDL
jgi:tetratricopeptide (TPR) repeat protein